MLLSVCRVTTNKICYSLLAEFRGHFGALFLRIQAILLQQSLRHAVFFVVGLKFSHRKPGTTCRNSALKFFLGLCYVLLLLALFSTQWGDYLKSHLIQLIGVATVDPLVFPFCEKQ